MLNIVLIKDNYYTWYAFIIIPHSFLTWNQIYYIVIIKYQNESFQNMPFLFK